MRSARVRPGRTRARLWVALVLAGAAGAAPQGGQEAPRLRYVANVQQLGPVAYRDPLGAISPDGLWLASTSGLHLRVQRVGGGPSRELGAGDTRITHLTWMPDGRLLVRETDFERTSARWLSYQPTDSRASRLWREGRTLTGSLATGRSGTPSTIEISPGELLQIESSPDGTRLAGLARGSRGMLLWLLPPPGGTGEAQVWTRGDVVGPLLWHPDGTLACVIVNRMRRELAPDCLASSSAPESQRSLGTLGEVWGPLAYSADGAALYFSTPNDAGALDLWRRVVDAEGTARTERLTRFSRDSYAPSVTRDGHLLFKVQDYRVSIATVSPEGGTPSALTTFQSETPSWDWDGQRVAFTYGTWRRVIDDAGYPDIDQHVGWVRADRSQPASEPDETVRSSYSEDQGLHWSPNGKFIALHSHADGTDDLWLKPADLSQPARPITRGGDETGWPRWSPDGRFVVYPTDDRSGSEPRLGLLNIVGIDQESGEVTVPQTEVSLGDRRIQATFAEWLPDSEHLVFEAIEGPRARAIYVVPRVGGEPRLVHRFESEQWFSGISVSPDGRQVVYVAPGPAGYFQLFRVPLAGGEVLQLTRDPSHKTQPAWSPKGDRIAFTVVSYQAHFWLMEMES